MPDHWSKLFEATADSSLVDVWEGRSPVAWSHQSGSSKWDAGSRPVGLLSGSFDPLHQGHLTLRDVAERWLNGPVAFELSILNAEKPALDYVTIAQRQSQFDKHLLAITRAPSFVEKAEIFQQTTFVVGIDTAERIIHPRFYDRQTEQMHQAFERIGNAGGRFLVAGRKVGSRFVTLNDLAVSAEFAELFVELPPEEFRVDTSSTQLRGEDFQ